LIIIVPKAPTIKNVTNMEKYQTIEALSRSDSLAASLKKSIRNKMHIGTKIINDMQTNQPAYHGTKAKFENSLGNKLKRGVPIIAVISPPLSQYGNFFILI
jgi:hypothetical protein